MSSEINFSCLKCKKDLNFTSYSYRLIKIPIKPKYSPNKYKTVGYLCNDCENSYQKYYNKLLLNYNKEIK